MQPAGRTRLAALLLRHVGRGAFTAAMLAGETLQIATLDGGSVVVDGTNGLRVDRVPAIGTGAAASNGTIFKLTRVLGS